MYIYRYVPHLAHRLQDVGALHVGTDTLWTLQQRYISGMCPASFAPSCHVQNHSWFGEGNQPVGSLAHLWWLVCHLDSILQDVDWELGGGVGGHPQPVKGKSDRLQDSDGLHNTPAWSVDDGVISQAGHAWRHGAQAQYSHMSSGESALTPRQYSCTLCQRRPSLCPTVSISHLNSGFTFSLSHLNSGFTLSGSISSQILSRAGIHEGARWQFWSTTLPGQM
jgi:hypothetical protein